MNSTRPSSRKSTPVSYGPPGSAGKPVCRGPGRTFGTKYELSEPATLPYPGRTIPSLFSDGELPTLVQLSVNWYYPRHDVGSSRFEPPSQCADG
jgi:hypothetical protein